MQSAVGSLLLVTSAVLLSCIIVGYTADMAAHILADPQSIAKTALKNLNATLSNQTSPFFEGTQKLDDLNQTVTP